DLLKKLPGRTIFVDFLRYIRFEQNPKVRGKKGEQRTSCYLAFVLRSGQPVRRVELGRAAPIEKALASWRQDIQDKTKGRAPAKAGGPAGGPPAKVRATRPPARAVGPSRGATPPALGCLAGPEERHRVAGRLRPGHRAARPLSPGPPDRRGRQGP